MRLKVVYRVTYPNGKIYIGMDLTGTLTYFGSPKAEIVAADFTPDEQRDFTVRKEILWSSESASDPEVRAMELELIRRHRSNDPAIGYNLRPRL